MPQVNIPDLPKIIQRPGLERLLERGADKRLTLVSGSPGQGKTTLVADILQRMPQNVFWYTLGPSNSNLARFIGDLIDFLQDFTALPGDDINSICTGSIEDVSSALAGFLGQFSLANGLVIVLDDFHTIDETGSFGVFIQSLVSLVPPDYHFIIITRREPSWKLAQKTIQRKMINISDAELAFSPAESHEFFREIYKMNLSRKQMEGIMSLTEGWAPVMVMLGEMLSDERFGPDALDIEAAFLLKKIPVLSVYLEQELFHYLSEEQQNVLMATSIAKEISSDLAKILAGETGATVLKNLNAMNMLVYPVEGEPGTFRLHSLWKSFLMQKAIDIWGEDKIRDLHRNAGNYFFSRNDWRAAIENYIHGQDIERSIEVLKRSKPEILGYDLADRLYSLIIKLPPERRYFSPWMSFALACSVKLRDPALWHHFLQEALEGFRKNNDVQGESYALGQSMTVLMYSGEFRQMQTIITYQSQRPYSQEALDLKTSANRNFYVALAHCYLTGNLGEGIRAGKETRKIGFILQDDFIKLWGNWALAFVNHYMGNFDVAQKRLSEAYETINPSDLEELASVYLPYLAGLIADFTGDFAAAQSFFADSLDKAQKLGMEAQIFYIKNFACYAALYLGDYVLCERLFNEMGDIMGIYMTVENDHIMAYYWTWRGHYMYVRGQYHEAAALTGQALRLREKTGGEIYLIECLLVLGGAMREIGSHQESERYLREALRRSRAAGSFFLEASCYLQLALLYDIWGDKGLFAESIDGLFALALEKSYYHFFMWKDDHVARIMAKIENRSEYAVYVHELHRRRLFAMDVNPEETRPEPLKLSMLGPLIIDICGTKHVNLGLKKPAYLLALLAVKSVPVGMETVMEEMWPETDIKAARNNFHFTLNRLRKFLGKHEYIILKDGLCSINHAIIWTDVGQFEALHEKSAKCMESNQIAEAIELLRQLCKIYRGDLLEGENLGPLLAAESKALAKKSYDALVALGRLLLQTGDYEEALTVLNQASSLSFADENSCRLLMLAHFALCNPGQALKIYNELEKSLALELQVSPHRKTKELRDLIRSGIEHPISGLLKWLSREDSNYSVF
ncbi:MAG: AAA family ATPase [Syntrophomonadaceae bacterium]|nr:AAA family ATPase [Syntrophomonadaceae bacterium]